MRIPDGVTLVDRVLLGLVVVTAGFFLCLSVVMVIWATVVGITGRSETVAMLIAIVLIPVSGAFLLAEYSALYRGNGMVAFFVAVAFLGPGIFMIPGLVWGTLGLMNLIPRDKDLNSWWDVGLVFAAMLFLLRVGMAQWRWFRGLSQEASLGFRRN